MEHDILIEEADIPYEEDILRNRFSVRCWLRYVEHKLESRAPASSVNLLFERALKELPGSYKLWYRYLCQRRRQLAPLPPCHPAYLEVNHCFRRCLVFMHKMPRIWLDFCDWLVLQRRVTLTRRTFDEALRALPLTQHDRVWPSYLKFVRDTGLAETALRVYRRYLKLMPENAEEYVEYLVRLERLDEAALRLAALVNDDKFVSKAGKSNYQLWSELCDLISKNPRKISSLPVEPILRQGIRRYADQVGALWCALAHYFTRAGLFEKARDIYEEGVQTAVTVRDFTQVYEAYTEFMEQLARAKMASAEEAPGESTELDLDLFMDRYEDLIYRRPLLLNSVLLRQNPHNVHEWHKRVELFRDNYLRQIETYTEALRTVDPKLQAGKVHTLWVSFAKLYEQHGQLDDARAVFEKALLVKLNKVEELASVWCEYAEMELRHDQWDRATALMKRATAAPPQKTHYYDENEPAQHRVYKSLKIWTLYADIMETLGDFERCKAVYERMLELRIATPQIVFNFGLWLEEQHHFEESFQAYERGVALFRWPHVFDIWNTYLLKFVARYGGKKLERVRDLFEQCLDGCPAEFCKNFYLLYAKLEEEHGLARHAMAIYDRATRAVPKQEMYDVFNIYIKKAGDLYGLTHTRAIFESALEKLPDDQAREMGLRFAELECKLGEVDRARAIYAHCSQLCDPRVHGAFWDVWKAFEVRHGNEETVREMLRLRRAVQAQCNTQVNFMSAQMLAVAGNLPAGKTAAELASAADSMALLEAKAQQLTEAGRRPTTANNIAFVSSGVASSGTATLEAANPEEIDLDLETEEGPDLKTEPQRQAVPSEVFGSLAPEDDD